VSLIYAVREDTGENFLLALKCDGCDVEIRPCPDIAQSGWVKKGWTHPLGVKSREDYCPNCAWEDL
jgi:hypothetical protein